jgi:hypothetical protein
MLFQKLASAAFLYTSTGVFLLLSLECRKWDISRLPFTPTATPSTVGNRKEKHTHSTKQNQREGEKINSDCSEFWKVASENYIQLVSTLAVFLKKCLRVSKAD